MHERVQIFPGILESIDCMHYDWKNCPTSWRGQMILEVIVDYRIWIWHAHFSVVKPNNETNMLNTSTLFTEQCKGNRPVIEFTANERRHHMGYYLANGIYPRWPVILKKISCPTDPKRVLFAQQQEAARKDVERDSVCFKCVGQ
ncbi:uncharacterized protein LOC121754442 [Salvia splendens]|uniref:uncharacterized protein LOC121754442 n=1 Tax=Salvia splendens TaxID=180675 RepID=UPI001C279EA0|nr:uncharacterized protein LOC121754442 [Salvia splendens]